MTRVAGRRYRRATVAGLTIGVVGVLGVASVAAPSGAQEPAPTSTTAPEPPPDTTPGVPTDPPVATPDTTGTTPTTTGDSSDTSAPGPATSTTLPDASAQDLPPAPAGATVLLDPPGELLDGTAVQITAWDLPAYRSVRFYQCLTPGQDVELDEEACDSRDVAWRTTNGAGVVSVTLRVDAILTSGEDEPVTTDCRAAGACSVVLFVSGVDGITTVVAPLPFAPDGPLAPPPTVVAMPAVGLVDGQSVTVTGSGMVWTSRAFGLQCAAAPVDLADCDPETMWEIGLDAAGSLVAAQSRVRAVIYTANGEVDCRVAGSCVLAVTADQMRSPQRRAVASLTFDPATAVVTPTLTPTPAADLVDRQVITVTGSGYLTPWVEVYLCGATPSAENCRWTQAWATVDGSGSFTTNVEVQTIVPTVDGDVDCRTSPDPCLLVASGSGPGSARAGRAELHFASDGPVADPPVITVDPDTDLPDEATVTVTGSGFRPDREPFVGLTVCMVTEAWLCDPGAIAYAAPDADGRFTVELDVAATFTPEAGGGPVDCRAAPGCLVLAGRQDDGATAPISFGPPPPPGEHHLDPVTASPLTPAAVTNVVAGTLPRTGAEMTRLAAVGVTLTVLGGTLVLARRRRLSWGRPGRAAAPARPRPAPPGR